MKIIFNIGWWFERHLYIIKNRIENEEIPSKDDSVYRAWKSIWKTYRNNKSFLYYSRVCSRFRSHNLADLSYKNIN